MEPRTDWQELKKPAEDARFVEYGNVLVAIAKARDRERSLGRALHVKSHVGARARLTTLANLPAPFRVGIFGAAGEYDAYARISNGAARRQHDRIGDLRGVALKVVGVPGKKIIPGLEHAVTQDFLAITTPALPFRDADEFMHFVSAVRSPATLLPKLLVHHGPVGLVRVIKSIARGTRPVRSMAEARYWSAAPIRWGAYAAKYSLVPRASGSSRQSAATPDFLTAELCARLQAGPVDFDLAVQLYVDPKRTPIEDASVEWRESDSPFVTVARLQLLQQDPTSEDGVRRGQYLERLSFDPWHAPEEFRPLGHMMRARAEAYKQSVLARGAADEPTKLEV